MAFEWSLVTGSVLGACIGLAGEWSGRLGARREATRTLQENQKATLAQNVELRELEALQRIVNSVMQLRPLATSPSGIKCPADHIRPFLSVVASSTLAISDAELRHRLTMVVDALELAVEGLLETMTLQETIYTCRHVLRTCIGHRLRHEPLPLITNPDWHLLNHETLRAIEIFKKQLRRPGYIAFSEIDEDSTG